MSTVQVQMKTKGGYGDETVNSAEPAMVSEIWELSGYQTFYIYIIGYNILCVFSIKSHTPCI